MFDRYVDAFADGHFRVTIEVHKQEDGSFKATWDGPNGQHVEAVNSSQGQAHRDVEAQIRDGVLARTIELGR